MEYEWMDSGFFSRIKRERENSNNYPTIHTGSMMYV